MRAALVVAGLAYAPAAHAVLLEDGNSLTVSSGGVSLQLTVSGCTVNSSGSTGCSGANEIVQDGSYLGVVVQSATGGNLLDANADDDADITFDLNITELSGPQLLNATTISTIGAGDLTSAGLALISPSVPENYAVPGGPFSESFSPSNSITESFDITAAYFANPTPTPYVLSVTQDFLAPEPAAFSLLVVGMTATMLLNRRRRR